MSAIKVQRRKPVYRSRKQRTLSCRENGPDQVLQNAFYTGELLISGDNLHVLNQLQECQSIHKKIRLVYIDPPFGTRQIFNVANHRVATISRTNGGEIAYRDDLSGEYYLKFLRQRLGAIRELMADDGTIYLHIDCKVGHYVKCVMDEVFGAANFINDITRIKCNPKNFNRCGYGNIKDMILFYRKGRSFLWNDLRLSVDPPMGERFRYIGSDGRRYTTTPLHAPGETINGATGKVWKGLKPPPGRHWRCSPEVLNELDQKGLIEWSSTGNPRKKIFADDVASVGSKIQDVWTFKDPQNPIYPTEKNINMLKLIISNSSGPSDIVLDAFCGSGTTLAAARSLGRRWIGIDQSQFSMKVCRHRLQGCSYLDLASQGTSFR